MVKFRQKIFFAPLAALGGGSALMGAFNVGSTAIGVGGMVQAHNQSKQQEEMNDQNLRIQERQAKQMEEQMKAQNKALQAIADNAAKNPMAANQTIDIMSMKSYSSRDISNSANFSKERVKLFGIGSVNKYLDAAKEGGKILWNNYKGGFHDMIGFGLGSVAAGYAVDRYIQHDKAKKGAAIEGTKAWRNQNRMQMNNTGGQRSYSAPASGGMGSVMKSIGKSALFGMPLAMLPLGMYKLNGSAEESQVNRTRDPRMSAGAGVHRQQSQQRAYSFLSNGWRRFKSHPGQSVLGFVNQMSMGGGQKRSFEVARQFKSSNNELLKKAGTWLSDHPKTLVAGAIVPAAAAMHFGEKIGEKPLKSAISAVDKDAFAYERSQNQTVK